MKKNEFKHYCMDESWFKPLKSLWNRFSQPADAKHPGTPNAGTEYGKDDVPGQPARLPQGKPTPPDPAAAYRQKLVPPNMQKELATYKEIKDIRQRLQTYFPTHEGLPSVPKTPLMDLAKKNISFSDREIPHGELETNYRKRAYELMQNKPEAIDDLHQLAARGLEITPNDPYLHIVHDILEDAKNHMQNHAPEMDVDVVDKNKSIRPKKDWNRREAKAIAYHIVRTMLDKGQGDRRHDKEMVNAIQDATGVGRQTAYKWMRLMKQELAPTSEPRLKLHSDRGVEDIDPSKFQNYIARRDSELR